MWRQFVTDWRFLLGAVALTVFFQWMAGHALTAASVYGLVAVLVIIYFWLYRYLDTHHPVLPTLVWLGVPYLLFAAGWLVWPIALLLVLAIVVASAHVYRVTDQEVARGHGWAGYLVLLCWVYLSGAGGYGLQVSDYLLHNGRLKDLIGYGWPVQYPDGQYLVGHFAYYLPAAVVGKAWGWSSAMVCMHLWTLMGVWLVLRWLQVLLDARRAFWLALLLAAFGGLDVVGYVLVHRQWPWGEHWAVVQANMDQWHFWPTALVSGFFQGNFLSNTFSLFWSPHQVIAGWLVTLSIIGLYTRGTNAAIIIMNGMLSFWSPLVAAAVLPVSLITIAVKGRSPGFLAGWIVASFFAATVLLVFGGFYLSGYALDNPFFLVSSRLEGVAVWMPLLAALITVGGYVLVMALARQENRYGYLLVAVTLMLMILPYLHYSEYSDLFCRGSSVVMIVLVFLVWRTVTACWHARMRGYAAMLVLMVTAGSLSAVLQWDLSVRHYQSRKDAWSVIDYQWGHVYLAQPGSFFEAYLLRK